ncbi:MAG: gas vesicle protein [Bacillota bacterium]
MDDIGAKTKDVTLLEVLDRLIDKGVVLHGDLVISIANIDLIYVGLRLIITSVDTMQRCYERGVIGHV